MPAMCSNAQSEQPHTKAQRTRRLIFGNCSTLTINQSQGRENCSQWNVLGHQTVESSGASQKPQMILSAQYPTNQKNASGTNRKHTRGWETTAANIRTCTTRVAPILSPVPGRYNCEN